MNRESMLSFLRANQPLPDFPNSELLGRYKAATLYFYKNPDEACVPLFLNSFAEWDDFSIYDSVQAVIRIFPKRVVLPHLRSALSSPHEAVRLWCADTAAGFPDEVLVPSLEKLLGERRIEIRMVSAMVLERIGTESARTAAAKALDRETDDDVREILEVV